MERVHHVLHRGARTENRRRSSKSNSLAARAASDGLICSRRERGHLPSSPRAIAMPTRNPPTTTIERATAHGRKPATPERISAQEKHRNGNRIGGSQRQPRIADEHKWNHYRNVDRKLSRQMPVAPSPSLLVNRGRLGSGIRCNLCRITSSCSGARPTPTAAATRPRRCAAPRRYRPRRAPRATLRCCVPVR